MLLSNMEDIASVVTQWENTERDQTLNVTCLAMPINQESVVEDGEIVCSSLLLHRNPTNQLLVKLKKVATQILETEICHTSCQVEETLLKLVSKWQ